MKRHVVASLISTLALAGSSMASPVIFDNGPPGGAFAELVDIFVSTNDFVLSGAATLEGFRLFTNEVGPWDGTLDYLLFEDANGIPAPTPFVTGAGQNIVRTFRGPHPDLSFVDKFEYSAALEEPIPLEGATRYWLGLHMQSGFEQQPCETPILHCEVAWESIFPPGGPFTHVGLVGFHSFGGTFDNWTGEGGEGAFQLFGVPTPSAVPEPSSSILALIGGGVALAGCVFRAFLEACGLAGSAAARRGSAMRRSSAGGCAR